MTINSCAKKNKKKTGQQYLQIYVDQPSSLIYYLFSVTFLFISIIKCKNVLGNKHSMIAKMFKNTKIVDIPLNLFCKSSKICDVYIFY